MENFADKNEEVFGLIISAYPPDKNIRLALLPTPRIEEKIYCLEENEVKIIDSDSAYQALEFDEMPYREREKLFNDLAKKH